MPFPLPVLLLTMIASTSFAEQCYSCAGTCHSEPCNCQMGSCQAEQCFIEKKPTENKGVYRITKGCMRNPSRTVSGCDYDHFSDHVMCVCDGSFCNDHIFVRPLMRRNVTCRKCPDRDPDCGETCHGQWCHEDFTTGAAGCGFGPPSLPFFYKGPELLYYKSKLCVTMSRGSGVPRRHCICNTNYCNHYIRLRQDTDGVVRSRSLLTSTMSDPQLPLRTCFNCELNTHDVATTASCKQNRCMGHYCTLAVQQINLPSGHRIVSEKQGCMNVTDNTQIHIGCSKKWMAGEMYEDYCACNDEDLCNRDATTSGVNRNDVGLIIAIAVVGIILNNRSTS